MTKTIEEQYQKKTPIEHILLRPDTYIGSVERESQLSFTMINDEMIHKQVSYVPGLYKIFDEILVNAADNKVRDTSMTTINVTFPSENDKYIRVLNDGKGIQVIIHKIEKVYIPELIFGQLLTSSNYDDKEKKITGGRNGYGAKLCNIFSDVFVVETCDGSYYYQQEFRKNMDIKSEPTVLCCKTGEGKEIVEGICAEFLEQKEKKRGNKNQFTRISFIPDLKRFGMNSLDDEIMGILKRRVYDLSGVVSGVKVVLDKKLLNAQSFNEYCKLYVDTELTYIKNGRWEVCFGASDDGFQQISFVNSICTSKGGTHVQHVLDQVMESIIDHVNKKEKLTIKPQQVKSAMFVFVNAQIENPTFDSQTKETLTLPARKFGSKFEADTKKLFKNASLMEKIYNAGRAKQSAQLKKTDGAKTSRLTGIPKLDDANMAGTRQSSKCTLILTEGDSAKTLAVSGLSVVGRDFYGVFPLRGKMLNVRDAAHKQIMENAEICAIKKILGLQHGKKYETVDSLRYGHVMVMTDQDHDGSHIKGLLINFFDHFYPELLRVPGFMQEFITPIIRVTRGKETKDFYNIPEFEAWKALQPNDNFKTKYYKGLGTSTPADAKQYFSNLPSHVKHFTELDDRDRNLLTLAFSKKSADQRKVWLKDFIPGTFLDTTMNSISISDFVNKELILFSMADNIRSIPSVIDGLKPGQRKVIYSCFKRKLHAELKVAQLAGYVAEHSAYHHGEQSLCATIVNLAQNFVGANNINLLVPAGQFGTRLLGGKDAASARYIFTLLEVLTRTIFHIHDDPVLTYLKDDNEQIEPNYYVPVIPMVLVNGAEGIGTGWSTSIPNYNPVDIVNNIKNMINERAIVDMKPFYKGFKGKIELISNSSDNIISINEEVPEEIIVEEGKKVKKIKVGPQGNRYSISGIYNRNHDDIEITELPVGMWTQTYKEFLETLVGIDIKDFKEYHTENSVRFVIKALPNKISSRDIEKKLKLTGTISTGNMVCFDKRGCIKKYSGPEEILREFYDLRLEYYSIRKEALTNKLYQELLVLENKARFIKLVVNEELIIRNKKKDHIELQLIEHKFTKIESSFDYLLNMPILSLTMERIERLNSERAEKEGEYSALLKKSIKDLWLDDLKIFTETYEKKLADEFKENSGKGKSNKGGDKNPTKRRSATRKKAWEKYGEELDDSD